MVPIFGGAGADCEESDTIEACALDATGCIGGCTAESAHLLASFVGCFEKNFSEGSTPPCFPKDATRCAFEVGLSAGIDRCLKSPERQKVAADWIAAAAAAADPKFFPTVLIDGEMDSDKAQNATQLQEALCAAGVSAAC